MSLENVEMWFHKNIDPIVWSKRSILKHIETVRNSSWVIFFTLIFPDWNLLTWQTNAIFAWQLHAEPRVLWKLECCQYFNAWNINDWQVKKTFSWKINLLFSKRALPYERFLFFTEYNLISKKVIENSDAYYPHYERYL